MRKRFKIWHLIRRSTLHHMARSKRSRSQECLISKRIHGYAATTRTEGSAGGFIENIVGITGPVRYRAKHSLAPYGIQLGSSDSYPSTIAGLCTAVAIKKILDEIILAFDKIAMIT